MAVLLGHGTGIQSLSVDTSHAAKRLLFLLFRLKLLLLGHYLNSCALRPLQLSQIHYYKVLISFSIDYQYRTTKKQLEWLG